ncbi:uncharacterized protein VNE69_07228 [Vairimorpha necatrix]|uniref:Membrane protein n=1 Tax=Vairimorpha necatrix TaxID=6039 RepID=A0AAX4JDX2_9MICR
MVVSNTYSNVSFFFCYLVLYYIDLIQFIIYGRLFRFENISKPGNNIITFMYIALLELLAFIAVSKFYIAKDLTGLVDLVLVKVEALSAILYIYISQNFLLPFYTFIFTDILLVLCFYVYWPVLYNIILQSYNRKIGLDIKIRDVYIIRHVYSGVKRLAFILYIILLFVNFATGTESQKYYRLQIYLLFLPILGIKILEREEEEENAIVKFVVICLLFLVSGYLIHISVIQVVNSPKSEYEILNFINTIHFILASLLALVDYANYGKGLKEATKIKRTIRPRNL